MEWTYPELDFEQRREADEIEPRVMDEPWNAAAQIIAARAENARLRKLVVWCLNNGSDFTDQPAEFTWWDGKADALRVIPTDGTDADLIRAALEAMGGVR